MIAEIDPTDYQVALDQAEADLATAQAQYVQASAERADHQRERAARRLRPAVRM